MFIRINVFLLYLEIDMNMMKKFLAIAILVTCTAVILTGCDGGTGGGAGMGGPEKTTNK